LVFRSFIYIYIYTGCPRRNGQNFGRVFLMLECTDLTQNTYVKSWTVTEIKAREKCGHFAVPRTVPGSRDVIPIRGALSVLVYSWLKHVPRCDCTCKVLSNPKDNYDMSASVFVVQITIDAASNPLLRELCGAHKHIVGKYRGAGKSLARPGRKQATATEDFDVPISYL